MTPNTVFEIYAIITVDTIYEVLAIEAFFAIEALKKVFRIVDKATINNIFRTLQQFAIVTIFTIL